VFTEFRLFGLSSQSEILWHRIFSHSQLDLYFKGMRYVYVSCVCLYIPGGVKFFLSVGFYHWEMNTDINNIDLANGQAHEVIMRRDENDVRVIHLQVRRQSYIYI